MKLSKKVLSLVLVAILALSTFLLTACTNNGGNQGNNGGNQDDDNNTPTFDRSGDISNYDSSDSNEMGEQYFNQNLFYTNSVVQGGPDPGVFDDTAVSGYYYVYVTSAVWRSKNLVDWEEVGALVSTKTDAERKILKEAIWAPEVIYDEELGKYVMFFSSTSEADSTYDGKGNGYTNGSGTNAYYALRAAVSDTAQGPFEVVNFKTYNNGQFAAEHNPNTTPNIKLDFENDVCTNDYAWVKVQDSYYQAAFPQYFVDYLFFNPEELYKVLQYYDLDAIRNGGTQKTIKKRNGNYAYDNIDPHPFVDPVSGNKYLFTKVGLGGCDAIMVVEMNNWLSPKWETATFCTVRGYYTLEDWMNDTNYGIPYEKNSINEGPYVLYHEDKNGKGLYYLTYSINSYTASDYSVACAVSENIFGPYRKLTEAEGGVILCSMTTESTTVSGAGHHSFISVGGQDFIVYHRHDSYEAGGSARYTAIDEYKWITVKDINGNDMDVPYVNGPTDSAQPMLEAFSDYRNVADEATVTSSDASVNASYLNDGLLSVHKSADETFMSYIKETEITKKTTFTFSFDDPITARAVLVYNSASQYKAFEYVDLIELVGVDGSVQTITGLEFDTERYCEYFGEFQDELAYVQAGTAAMTEFYDTKVKEVRVTMSVPEGQDVVGISEIRILGKDGEPTYTGEGEYTFTNPSKVYATVDEGVTLDGEFDEEQWENARWLTIRDTQSKTQYADISFTTWYGENGVYFGVKVEETGNSIYYNSRRATYLNSCIEMYMAPADAEKNATNIIEFDFLCNGNLNARINSYGNGTWTKFAMDREYMPVAVSKLLGGSVNTPECYGYQLECMFPYEYLEALGYEVENLDELELALNPVHIWSFNETGTSTSKDRYWSDYWSTQYCGVDSTWLTPSAWLKFNKDGLMAYDYNLTVTGDGPRVKITGNTSKLGLIPYGNNAQLTLNVVNGGKNNIKSITINGEEYDLSKISWTSNAVGQLTISNVTEDLEIVIETTK